jgi:phytoene synthase
MVDVQTRNAQGGVNVSGGEAVFNERAAAAALAHCRDVTRRCARNFYYGLKLSPEPQRSALYVIYTWMRRADDFVDASDDRQLDKVRNQLREFRAATDAALAGSPDSSDPLSIGLAATARQFCLSAECFHAMLDGQNDDLDRKVYATFDELREYCFRVASTVGLLCIEIWGYADPRARDMAINLGIAFQLTNILRDFGEDFDAGRVYIPNEDFERHGLTAIDVRRWTRPDACQRFMLEQIDRCDGYYQKSAGLEELITPSCRPTLWAMSSIYRGLLVKMHRNPARVVAPSRLRLSSLHKGMIAFKARWLARSMSESPVKRWNDTPSRISGD